MTLELWSTFATFGTFVVIAASAIAAFVQLRHMRGTNSITALTECREVMESEEFRAAERFISHTLPELLEDANVRERLRRRPLDAELSQINVIGNFYENLGGYIRYGIVDKEVALSFWSGVVVHDWDALTPALAIFRRDRGPGLWEQFEYLAKISQQWIASHPNGTYPRDLERLPVIDVWLEADRPAAPRSAR